MNNFVIFYDHLEYFTALWYNLWPLSVVCCHLVHCLRFGMFGPRRIWQPWSRLCSKTNYSINQCNDDRSFKLFTQVNAEVGDRVIRLGEFSPPGDCFLWPSD
jgi:hypothetical protein